MESLDNNGKKRISLETTIGDLLKEERETISLRLSNSLNIVYRCGRDYFGREVKTIEDLLNLKEVEIFQLPNFGKMSLDELNLILTKYKLPHINIKINKKYHQSWRGKY
jgi:DNA-directed RNA polymerase alpha subunit